MFKIMFVMATIALILHGLIHLMGTAAYLKLAEVQGLPYKTSLLGGRWVLGEPGIAVYGVLWAVAAAGFVLAALTIWFGWGWWQPILLGTTFLSLVLTALDWNVAFAGVIVNVVILVLLGLGPRLTAAFAG